MLFYIKIYDKTDIFLLVYDTFDFDSIQDIKDYNDYKDKLHISNIYQV